MGYKGSRPDGDWTLYECVINGRSQCTAKFKDANAAEFQAILSDLQLLRASGMPTHPDRLAPPMESAGKCKVSGSKTAFDVTVLKVKPSHWRLYFIVSNPAKREIEFLHAVKKKTWKRDPADIERCCYVLGERCARRTQRMLIDIPAR